MQLEKQQMTNEIAQLKVWACIFGTNVDIDASSSHANLTHTHAMSARARIYVRTTMHVHTLRYHIRSASPKQANGTSYQELRGASHDYA